MPKPLLFLDVDGVLNVENPAVPCSVFYENTEHEVVLPEGTRKRLSRIIEVFEPVWATAWLGEADPIIGPLLDVSDTPWPYLNYNMYKVIEILRYAKGRPWAWIDDDAAYELRNLTWWPDYTRYLDGLIVIPDRSRGITDAHVEELLNFASR